MSYRWTWSSELGNESGQWDLLPQTAGLESLTAGTTEAAKGQQALAGGWAESGQRRGAWASQRLCSSSKVTLALFLQVRRLHRRHRDCSDLLLLEKNRNWAELCKVSNYQQPAVQNGWGEMRHGKVERAALNLPQLKTIQHFLALLRPHCLWFNFVSKLLSRYKAQH